MDPEKEAKIYGILADDPSFIILLKNKFITDDMWKFVIEKEPSLFRHMKEPSEEMILFALKEDGANAQYLEQMGVNITPKMLYTAVHSYPGAIYLIPKEYRTANLREYACKEEPSLNERPSSQNTFH